MSRPRSAGPGCGAIAAPLAGARWRAKTGPRGAAGPAAGAAAGVARALESPFAGTAGWVPTGAITMGAAGVPGSAAGGVGAVGAEAIGGGADCAEGAAALNMLLGCSWYQK